MPLNLHHPKTRFFQYKTSKIHNPYKQYTFGLF